MKKRLLYLLLFLCSFLITACNKTVVNFGEEALTEDPNIIYLDSFTIKMSTYQLDSFATANDSIFKTGQHNDSLLGKYNAQTWFQLSVPQTNPLSGCANCSFDSLVFMTRFTGSYYGDTTGAFVLQVHRLTRQMNTDYSSIGYNVSHFEYDPSVMAATAIATPRPSKKQAVFLHLPDDLGLTFFGMLKRNTDTMSNQDKFVKFFKGLVLKGAANNSRSVYYFGLYDSSSRSTVRLYYSKNGSTQEQGHIDFMMNPAAYQFNTFSYDKTGTPLAPFKPGKKQTIASSLTGDKVFLHAGSGLFPRFTLPDMMKLKELHPYIKVVKATLEITPRAGDYGPGSLYNLPPLLGLYPIDDLNAVGSGLLDLNAALQTGNLVVDYLYHKDTRYSYDLTAYVNKILSQGRSAQQDLLLLSLSSSYENRLILNAAGQQMSLKLKLYVLGL